MVGNGIDKTFIAALHWRQSANRPDRPSNAQIGSGIKGELETIDEMAILPYAIRNLHRRLRRYRSLSSGRTIPSAM